MSTPARSSAASPSEGLAAWTQYQSASEAAVRSGGWLAATRQRALERFMQEGWPHARQDDWRHTSLTALANQVYTPASGQADPGTDIPALQRQYPGIWLVFVDGHYSPAWSSNVAQLPAGVRIQPLSQAWAQPTERLQAHIGEAEYGASPTALNLALCTDGVYLDVPAGAVLEQPLHLLFVAATAQTAGFTRNVVVLGRNAQATLVEHYLGGDTLPTFSSTALRIVLEHGARLTHCKLQREGQLAYHLSDVDAVQEEGSVYEMHALAFGSRLARNDISTRLAGRRSEVLLNGLFYVDGQRHIDHHTRIEHAQPDATSREYYRGIVNDSARGVFAGRIRVLPGADGTDAVQRIDNLLLTGRARADARPELEIYADDVKCAHGATAGQIDEDSLFYLRARGFSPEHARSALTYAFAAQALQRIGHEPLRRHARQMVRDLLPGGGLLGELE